MIFTIKKVLSSTILVGTLLTPLASSAATQNTSYTENNASAYFSSLQGCDDVVVGVSAVETQKSKPQEIATPSQAFVFGSFNNICDIGSSYSFAGIVNLEDKDFMQSGIKDGALKISRNIGGYDVSINLKWDGVGKADKYQSKLHLKNDGIIIHDTDVIRSRSTNISGSFLINGIQYATGTKTGGLSEIKAHTIQIYK